jgi:hypothetical protein
MHASIQKAVDAAPAGAVIRIAPGTYEERVVIQKPLTLEGAGPGRTRLVSRTVNIAAEIRKDKNLMAELERRYREAGSEAERRAMFRAIARELKEKHGLQPTVLVRAAEGVAIRDLRITLLGEREEGKKGLGAALELDRARVKVSGCAIAGSSANGVVASAGSTLEMEKCLVAGVWGTGILLEAVEAADGPPAPHRVSDCDVRHCYHRGIVIGAGNDAATVERCRISGSAWHGIRYDDASPAISGNAIFANARFGIYASGKTAAAVRGNLFVANAMAGVSCWFESRDRIEGNTFALNRRAGVEALRASKPEVRGNIFFAQPTAVFFEDRGSLAAGAASEGRAALERNLFWQNDKKTVWPPPPPGEEPAAETPLSAEGDGNVEDDPGFQSVEVQDFTLTADSPARRDRLGAADPIPLDSPWPPQPEEEAVRAALSRQD